MIRAKKGISNWLKVLLLLTFAALVSTVFLLGNGGFQHKNLQDIYEFPKYQDVESGTKKVDSEPNIKSIGDDLDNVQARLNADNLQKDDQIYTFTKANVGVVYRPSQNKIVYLFTPSAVASRALVEVYGSDQAKLNQIKAQLEASFGASVLVKLNQASNLNFEQSVVVDIAGSEAEATKQIADLLKLNVVSKDEVPNNLNPDKDAKFIILVQ